MFSQEENKADPRRWFTDLHAPRRDHCGKVGWLSEAHRLSLGADRPENRATLASDAKRLHADHA